MLDTIVLVTVQSPTYENGHLREVINITLAVSKHLVEVGQFPRVA